MKTTGFDNFTFRNIAGRAGRMRRYFIGKVFVLEAAPADEALSVDVAVGRQDENTPVSLILELPEEDLAPISKARVGDILATSPLSIHTLRLNRHIDLERQYAIHDVITRDIVLLEDALVWSEMPQPFQLRMVCELIHDHLDGATLNRYGIKSGTGLKAELDRLRFAKTFRAYIDHRVTNKSPYQTISESVEQTLQLMRRYVGYTFPRSLMAISHIQAEVLTRAGRPAVGDYSLFASRAGSLFLNASVFALDEYGIPPETARRLTARGADPHTLDEALALAVDALDRPDADLHAFEREIIADLQRTLSPRQLAS